MAPGAGLEPATYRLTAGRSAIELSWNMTPVYRPGDTHSFQLRKTETFSKTPPIGMKQTLVIRAHKQEGLQ